MASSTVAKKKIKNFLDILPPETLNKIYGYVFPDYPAGALVEIEPDFDPSNPWSTNAWIFQADGNGVLKRTEQLQINRGLFAICRKIREENKGRQFWETANLLFTDTILLWKVSNTISISIKSITILRYLEGLSYSGLNEPNKRSTRFHPGNNTDLFRSLACLRTCPQLQTIDIHVSIYNCEHQYVISQTLTHARAILGYQARLHIAVKHCVNCDPDNHAFDIPYQDFRAYGRQYLPARHNIPFAPLWEWTCAAGSQEWVIQRFIISPARGKLRIWSLDEYIESFEKTKVEFGEAVALQRIKTIGRALKTRACFFCRTACEGFPENVVDSQGWWCARCGTHPWCHRPQCRGASDPLDTNCVLGPPELKFITATPVDLADYNRNMTPNHPIPSPWNVPTSKPGPHLLRGHPRRYVPPPPAPLEPKDLLPEISDEEFQRLDEARNLTNYREPWEYPDY